MPELKSWCRIIRVPALSVLVAVGASPFVAVSSQAQQETVRAVMHSALRILDPVASSGTITRNHGYMIFDTLVAMDENFEPRPQMADWTVSDDRLSYTFTFRDGLSWHDGTPVTAQDCIASLERWARYDAAGRMLMDRVEAIDADGPNSFVIRLSEPFGYLVDVLAKPSAVPAFMMPERVADIPLGEQIGEQIGSGPFRFVADEFQPGVQVVYEKFEDYVPRDEPASGLAGGKVVNVARVEWINMPDVQTSINALQSGDIDYIERTPIDLLPLFEGNDEIRTGVQDPLGMQVSGRPNFLHPPFDDPEIRRAALAAISQEDVLTALIGNADYYDVCGAVLGCGTPFASEEGAERLLSGGSVDEARALLEASDYDGMPIVILQPTDVATLSVQPVVVADALRRAGFEVRLEPMDWQTLVSRRANRAVPAEGGWNLFFTNANVDSLLNPIVNTLLEAAGPEQSWFGWPTDTEMEQLRSAFALAQTQEERGRIAADVQRRALDQVLLLPLGQFRNVASWRSSLDGFVTGPVPVFWQVSKTE